MTQMTIEQAKEGLLQLLAEHMPGWKPYVLYWEPAEQGVRIQEVGWEIMNPTPPVTSSGISCIGDDAAPVHFFAERFLLALVFEEPWRIEEARDSLLTALGEP